MEFVCSGWCCVDCLFLLANGDTPTEMSEAETLTWLADIELRNAGHDITLGMLTEDHNDTCPRKLGDRDAECDCETITFSTSPCDVCGSNLHGERHAVAFFKSGS